MTARTELEAKPAGSQDSVITSAKSLFLSVSSCFFPLLVGAAVTGCKSGSLSSCVAPCVTGRVVAADTGQPLAGAKVRRVNPSAEQTPDEPAKGAQLMAQTPTAFTDQAGNFVLDAEMALTPIIHRDWYSVTVSFEHEGYLPLRTNYNTLNVNGRTADGAPMVKAGDVRLKPAK